MLGESQIVLCGGVDNMSMAPYAVRDIRFGTRLGKAPEVRHVISLSIYQYEKLL